MNWSSRVSVVTIIATLFFSKISLGQSDPKWIAFGDIRGHLEPCGCDPRTDLGSIVRLDSYISRERKLIGPDLLVFSLGNAFSLEDSEVEKSKNAAIASAIALVKPDASLPNRAEMILGSQFLPGQSYVLSNIKNQVSVPLSTKPFIEFGDAVVFGFLEPKKGLVRLQNAGDASWYRTSAIKAFSKSKTKKLILLFSGSDTALKKIIQLNIFDLIVASNGRDFKHQFDDSEHQDRSRLVRVKNKSMVVWQVPFGGAGVLRSPSLYSTQPAQPLSEVLLTGTKTGPVTCNSPLSTLCMPEASGKLATFYDVVWLDKQYESGASASISEIILNYRKQSGSRMVDLIKQKEEFIKTNGNRFSGSQNCESCHSKAHETWIKSKHANSLQTLEKSQRDSDPECVSCHVVGFNEKDGFVQKQASPHLAAVGCEACHGPLMKHASGDAVKPPKITKKVCDNCHTPPHSPNFNFEKYWNEIRH